MGSFLGYSLVAVVILLLTGPADCGIAADTLTQTDVFLSGQDGYDTYRIPSVLRARDGTLLAFCEGRKNSRADTGDIDLLVKRSSDDGASWSAATVIWDRGTDTCGNPCPVLDEETGTIWLLLTQNPGEQTEDRIKRKESGAVRNVWISKSEDHGKSWTAPTEITSAVKDPSWGWYATGPGIGIQLRHGPHRGRLIVPCDHSYPEKTNNSASAKFEAASHIIYSDDHGKTWNIGGSVFPNMNECQVVEMADGNGSLLLNMRNYFRDTRRSVASSHDGGLTWSAPKLHRDLIEPRCQASLLRYSWPEGKESGHILFSNPASTRRTNLVVRLSYDDGVTWPCSKVLHPGPAAYSCLVALPNGQAGCLYERGQTNAYERITFARFSLSWLQQGQSDGEWKQLKREALERRRRLIFNNDGNEPVYFCKNTTVGDLLQSRTTALAGSQVDSIFYCTWSSGFGMFTHRTKAGQVFDTREAMFKENRTRELLDKGIDPLQVMVDFAHKHDIELFWSMRMNDTHDGARADYGPVMFRANRLKQEHPEWLIGSKENPPKYGAWTAVDYARPEIRELAFRYLEEVCQNYEIDGVELDFFRHAFLFRCSATGKACGKEELDSLTALLKRARAMSDTAGRKRKRPILIAVRVPDSIDYCKFIGIDLERWLSEQLVDLLIVGGYTQLNPWDYSVALGHKYGVKVYPSLDEPRVRDLRARELRESLATYRGRAMNAWAAGADGIYLFNFFNPNSSLWRELGDPSLLGALERNYFASILGVGSMPVPHKKFINVPTLNPGAPISVVPGKTVSLQLPIGEDLRGTDEPSPVLRLQCEGSISQLSAALNEKELLVTRVEDGCVEFHLNAAVVRKGLNRLTVSCAESAKNPVVIQDLYLTVRPP